MVTAISFVIVLSILVFVHELGHFVVGRWAGARIEEFALGFPPRLWSIRRGETDYSINAIPLGGYCRFAGEDNPDVSGGLSQLPRLKRVLVLVAGVTMNALLAIIVFAIMFMTGYPTATAIDGVQVASVVQGAPAATAGLMSGDLILKVNGQLVKDTNSFSTIIRAEAGKEVALTVKRSGSAQEDTVRLTPRANPPQGEGPLGISIQQAATVSKKAYALPQALALGVERTWSAIKLTFYAPVLIVRGVIPAAGAVSGPLGIARIVGSATNAIPTNGFYPLLSLTALLSISLAVVNILPLPGLDGGRIVFVILEWLRGGKRINPQREAIIHFSGLVFLIGAILIITFFDIVSPAPPINWGP